MPPPRERSDAPSTPIHGSATHVRSDPVYVAKAQLLRVLGHPVRIRILELLSSGERIVEDLQAELQLDSSGTSQHLAALRQQGVLQSRRAGSSVYYSIRDPRVSQLLAVAKHILTSALSDSHTLLSELAPKHFERAMTAISAPGWSGTRPSWPRAMFEHTACVCGEDHLQRRRVGPADPAVHQEAGRVDVARLVAGQEQDGVGDLVGPREASHRHVHHPALRLDGIAGVQVA
jgi:DNA-binding transcriptional ArsR family regulator